MTHAAVVIAAYRGAWSRRRLFVPLYLALRLLVLALVAPGVAALINVAVSLSSPSEASSGATKLAVVMIATVDEPCAVLMPAAITNGSRIPIGLPVR